jgi:hypothetical protein
MNITASKQWLSNSGQLHTVSAQGITEPLAYAALLARCFVMKPSLWVIGSGRYSTPVSDFTLGYDVFATSGETQDLVLNLARTDGSGLVVDRASVRIKDATISLLVAGSDGIADHTNAALVAIAAAYRDANGNSGFGCESAYYID